MRIWELKTDSERFGSPYITSQKEADYYIDIFNNQFYTGQSVSANWKATMVYNFPEGDIGKVAFGEREFWLFTENAKVALESLLGGSVEFLPLIHRENISKKISYAKQILLRNTYKPLIEIVHPEPHYLLNILDLKPIESIDFEQSEFEYNEEKRQIFMTESLAFHPLVVGDAPIFKIMNHGRGLQMKTFVSDEFRKTVKQHNLKGLSFSRHGEDEGNLVWENKIHH